jgi:molybdopterin/thiamine biosynthesis adenylyltransferase
MTDDRDFSRQSFLGAHSKDRLANLRAVVVGLGGGGSHIAQQLAHVGVGNIRLIDPEAIEASNLNRLIGGTKDDVDHARPKVEIAKRTIIGIRPWASVITRRAKWQEADDLIRDAHVMFGCVDGYQQRDYLETAARRFGMPYIDIGMDVTKLHDGSYAVAGQMIASLPGHPCMRCLGFLTPDKLAQEENRYGDAGINPQVVWTNGTLASLAVGALAKLFTPWFPVDETYTWLELDGNAQTVTRSRQPDYFPRAAVCPHHGGPEGLGEFGFDIRSALAGKNCEA